MRSTIEDAIKGKASPTQGALWCITCPCCNMKSIGVRAETQEEAVNTAARRSRYEKVGGRLWFCELCRRRRMERVKEIVEAHDHAIQIQSARQKGIIITPVVEEENGQE